MTIYTNSVLFLQLPVTHDDIFGEYMCEASNKMGSLTRHVRLSEGAKPGIPSLEIYKINTETVEMTLMVSSQKRNISHVESRNLTYRYPYSTFRNTQLNYIYES